MLLNIEYFGMFSNFVDSDVELLIGVTLCFRKDINNSLAYAVVLNRIGC